MTHKLQNNYTKEILALLRKFQELQQISQPGDLAKSLRTPREFDFGGQWDLITELTQDWGNRLLESTNTFICIYTFLGLSHIKCFAFVSFKPGTDDYTTNNSV